MYMSKVKIRDSAILITGANRGIGRALAEEALARGAGKIYASARSLSSLDDLLEQDPRRIACVELDVTNSKHIRGAVGQAPDIQILINNAGVAAYTGFIFAYNEDAERQEMETNYFGALNVTRAFARTIIENGNGAVVNVLSIAGLINYPPAATYSASKAAANSLTQGLRAELAGQGVPVFGVYPGPIDTDMAAGLQMEKFAPRDAAIRIFDGIEDGMQDITTDRVSDRLIEKFKTDPKSLESERANMAHSPADNGTHGG